MRISDWSSDVCSSDLLQVLEQHVGSGEEPVQRRPALRAAEVQRDAALAGIVGGEVAADAAELRMPATRILAAGRFDLDDLGAEIGEIPAAERTRSEEHTSELQSLMRISYAVFCLKKKKKRQLTIQFKNTVLTSTTILARITSSTYTS